MNKGHFLVGCIAFTTATAGQAQSWGPAGQQPIVYSTEQVGDGSNAQGGIAPALEDGSAPQEPADIASTFTPGITTRADWLTTASVQPGYNNGSPDPGYAESKLRIHCMPSHVSKADPITAPGNPNGPHVHVFFGNELADENSTYTSLRTTGGSTCAGGPLNRTAYWNPALLEKLASGLIVVRLPDWYSIYYPAYGVAARNTRIPRNFNYIFGYDTSDPLPGTAAQRAALPAGRAFTHDTAGGEIHWTCEATGKEVPYLKNAAGEDMFLRNDGNASTTDAVCPTSSRIQVKASAPRCWDGKNLSSPGGRQHVLYPVRNVNTGQMVCQDNAYWLPDFQLTTFFTFTQPQQYMNWWLSSDRMNAPSTPADPNSPSECRRAGPYFCNGETWHGDWFGAWDYGTKNNPGVMLVWMNDCSGTTLYNNTGTMVSTGGAGCSDSQVSNAAGPLGAGPRKLLTNGNASPDPTLSNDPVISFTASSEKAVVDRYVVSPWIDQTDPLIAHGSHGQ